MDKAISIFINYSPVIFDLRSNTKAAAWTLFSFLLLKKILAVTQSLTREVNLILYLNELLGSMMNYSSESMEKSGCPSSLTVYPIVFDVGFVNSMFFTTFQIKLTKKISRKSSLFLLTIHLLLPLRRS